MLVKVFNLRMDFDSMQYDDSVLVQFASEQDVISMKTQFFYFQEEPIWSVIVTYRSKYKSSALQQSVRNIKSYRNISTKEVEPEAMSPFNQAAYEAMRVWRNTTARQLGHPPSNLFTNRQLEEIVYMNPSSIHQLTKISGIGKYKSSTYGHEILALLHKNSHTSKVGAITDRESPHITSKKEESLDASVPSDQKKGSTDGGHE